MKTLGERVSFLIDNMEITQVSLAKKIEISPMTLSKYIQNKNEPRSSTIAKLAKSLNTTSDYIVGLSDDFSPPDGSMPISNKREQELLFNFRKLSEKDKIKIEERILTLSEQ